MIPAPLVNVMCYELWCNKLCSFMHLCQSSAWTVTAVGPSFQTCERNAAYTFHSAWLVQPAFTFLVRRNRSVGRCRRSNPYAMGCIEDASLVIDKDLSALSWAVRKACPASHLTPKCMAFLTLPSCKSGAPLPARQRDTAARRPSTAQQLVTGRSGHRARAALAARRIESATSRSWKSAQGWRRAATPSPPANPWATTSTSVVSMRASSA